MNKNKNGIVPNGLVLALFANALTRGLKCAMEDFKLSPFSRFVSGITDESPDHVHKPAPKDVLYQLLLQSLKVWQSRSSSLNTT